MRILVAGLLLIASSRPSIHYVAPDGADDGPGTAQKPFRTIQRGLEAAGPGETVRVRRGFYRGAVKFPRSGEKGKPITLEGEPGAILDGGEVVPGWVAAPEIGPGVYKNPGMTYFARAASWNNRIIPVMKAGLGYAGTEKSTRDALTCPPTGRTAGEGRMILENWWDGVEAVHAELDGIRYLRFRDGRDPSQEDLVFSRENTAVVVVEKTDFVIVRGLTVRNAQYGIVLIGANDCIVEENYVSNSGKSNILIAAEAGRNEIRNNELTQNYVYPDFGHPWASPLTHHIWSTIKDFGYGDEMGIRLEGHGDDNRLHGNHIFRHFDGINEKSSSMGRRTKVFNNILSHIADDAMAPEGAQIDCEWHDNVVVEGGNGAMTVSPGKHLRGPLYVYRNRFTWAQNQIAGSGIHFKNRFPLDAVMYFYHNTVVGNYDSLGCNGDFRTIPTSDNVYFFNNIFSSPKFYRDCWEPPQFGVGRFDHNWCGGMDADYLVGKKSFGPNNIVATNQLLWTEYTNPDFLLKADSTARGKGVDVSRPFTLFGKELPAMAGFKPGYFAGKAPDLGALQHGRKPPVSTAPEGLTAKIAGGNVVLHWKDTTNDETGVLVDRSADGKVFTTIARLPANATTFTDDAPQAAKSFYRVWAIQVNDGAWFSPFSGVARSE